MEFRNIWNLELLKIELLIFLYSLQFEVEWIISKHANFTSALYCDEQYIFLADRSNLIKVNLESGFESVEQVDFTPITISKKWLFGISNDTGQFYRNTGNHYPYSHSLEDYWPKSVHSYDMNDTLLVATAGRSRIVCWSVESGQLLTSVDGLTGLSQILCSKSGQIWTRSFENDFLVWNTKFRLLRNWLG